MRLFGLGSAELCRFEIPGGAEVDLPEGRVKLRFEQKRESKQRQAFGPPQLEVEIVPAGGGAALEVKPPRTSSSSAGRVLSAPVGTVEVPAAGRYRVTVSTSVERPEPVLVVRA